MNLKLLLLFTLLTLNRIMPQEYDCWIEIDSLNEARVDHASVVLPNGNVLVSGNGADSVNKSCEIYNINSGKWDYTTPMIVPRSNHHMILLDNGKVLAIGGYKERSCELFDSDTKNWQMTDSIPTVRYFGQSVVKLYDGRILVCGGMYIENPTEPIIFLNNCDIYDPTTENWIQAAPMLNNRKTHTATLLNDGKVLVTGGFNTNGALKSCEIYDPIQDNWEPTNDMLERRSNHSSIILQNGIIFISGGTDLDTNIVPWKNSCEIYDPITETWESTSPMIDARESHTIFKLKNPNKILILGGSLTRETPNDTWELFDTQTMQSINKYNFPIKVDVINNSVQLFSSAIMVIGGWEFDFFDNIPYRWPTKRCFILNITTNIENDILLDYDYSLVQNYPNPFNPITTIKYAIPKTEFISLILYDILGCEVGKLISETKMKGNYTYILDGSNLSSGIYIIKLTAGKYSKTIKAVLLK